MISISFIDTEIDWNTRRICDIGAVRNDGTWFHSPSVPDFIKFISGTKFICGHNILNHDIKFIGKALADSGHETAKVIDTLYLSPLLFPSNPYHSLVKNDELQSDERNNPLNDSIKAKDLFYDEVASFQQLDESLRRIFYLLKTPKSNDQHPRTRPNMRPSYSLVRVNKGHSGI